MRFLDFIKSLRPYLWRLVFTLLGLTSAVSFLVFGIGKTILILLCCVIGYLIGLVHDKNIPVVRWLRYWWSNRR